MILVEPSFLNELLSGSTVCKKFMCGTQLAQYLYSQGPVNHDMAYRRFPEPRSPSASPDICSGASDTG